MNLERDFNHANGWLVRIISTAKPVSITRYFHELRSSMKVSLSKVDKTQRRLVFKIKTPQTRALVFDSVTQSWAKSNEFSFDTKDNEVRIVLFEIRNYRGFSRLAVKKWNSEQFSDMTLVCKKGKQTLPLHRIILAELTEYFERKAHFDGNLPITKIVVDSDQFPLYKALFEFCYTRELSAELKPSHYIALFKLAHEFDITFALEPLAKLTIETIERKDAFNALLDLYMFPQFQEGLCGMVFKEHGRHLETSGVIEKNK